MLLVISTDEEEMAGVLYKVGHCIILIVHTVMYCMLT